MTDHAGAEPDAIAAARAILATLRTGPCAAADAGQCVQEDVKANAKRILMDTNIRWLEIKTMINGGMNGGNSGGELQAFCEKNYVMENIIDDLVVIINKNEKNFKKEL
jgi:hypothetical protein